jgi:hypothetical protein
VIPGDEYSLIKRIQQSSSTHERQRLIAELDAMPIRIYHFYHRWMLIHDVSPNESWNADGFHPERCPWPRDVQLLWATSYGKADIDNGGFHQFFSNNTGIMAPEVQECLERMDLHATADVVKNAMLVFGQPFPRARAQRLQFLDRFQGNRREDWNPFHVLDDPFYASFKGRNRSFEERADKWLREQCGIEGLGDSGPKLK